jgi:hypothetical protein
MQANRTMPAVLVPPIACHGCGAVATVRRAKEYLCARCAVFRVGVDPGDRPVVLCDRCGRQSLVRLRESFLCARCATEPGVQEGRIDHLELANDIRERIGDAVQTLIGMRMHLDAVRTAPDAHRRVELDRLETAIRGCVTGLLDLMVELVANGHGREPQRARL